MCKNPWLKQLPKLSGKPCTWFCERITKGSWHYNCGTFSGRTYLPTWTSALSCQTTYRLNICELVWPYKGVFGGFIVGPPRAIQTTQLWRELWSWQLSILAFDIDLFFVTILLLLNRKQHWNPNGAPFQCWFLLTWLGWSQKSRVDPETKVGSSTEQFSSTCLCLYWSWWAKPCCQWHSACVSILSCKCFTLRARCQVKVLIQICSSVLSQFVLPLYLQELFAIF